MFYVYIIKSRKTGEIYIGLTNNLKRRIEEHNQGNSISTKSNTPWELIYFEGYKSEKDAILREKGLKYFGKPRTYLRHFIERYNIFNIIYTVFENRCGVKHLVN